VSIRISKSKFSTARKKLEEFDAKGKKGEAKFYCHTRLNSSQAHQHNRPLADIHST
jgi:hypothetical protein